MYTYAGTVLGTMLVDLAKIIHYVCYPECSSTIYGTPAMTDSEAIVLRLVTKDWRIIELFVRLQL